MTLKHLQERIGKYKDTNPTKRKHRIKHYKITASVICMEIVASVITGIFIGHLLDNLFNTRFVFKIICLLIACVASFVVLYRQIKK